MKKKQVINEEEITKNLIAAGFNEKMVVAARDQVAAQDAEAVKLLGEGTIELQNYRDGITVLSMIVYKLGPVAGPLAVKHMQESEAERLRLLAETGTPPVTGVA